jgi:hypothetical protein
MNKDDNAIVISKDDTDSVDLGYYDSHLQYVAAQPTHNIDTITIDSNNFSLGSITSASTLTWSQPYDNYNTGGPWNNNDPGVNITGDGVIMKDDCDLKIGNRSLKDFMNKVEDQLAILRPAPELEEKWESLKDLRRQYETLRQDILEKEKIMKILKEQ